ncbi:MAG: ABC transporter ATP-binding protein [Cyanobacteria bacterium J06638_20]
MQAKRTTGFRDLLNYFAPYKKLALLGIAFSSFFELTDLVVPYSTGQILNILSGQTIDNVTAAITASIANALSRPATSGLTLTILLTAIGLATVGRAPLEQWLGHWFHWYVPLKARRDHGTHTIAQILRLPLEYYDENNPGRIAGRVARGIENHTWSYPEVAGQLIPKAIRVAGIFLIIALIEWRIALFFLASFLFVLSFTLKGLQRLVRAEEIIDHYMEGTESRTSELVSNIKTIKAFATETKELKRQQTRFQREFDVIVYRIHKGYVNLFMWQRITTQASLFLVLGLTLWATVQGQLTLGHFITALTVSSMAYAEIEPISAVAETFARRYASMVRYHEFLKLPAGQDAAVLDHPEGTPSYAFSGKVHFEGVSFGYERDRPVLQDINLLIEPCQTVALVGRSGSGKSTLVKLLFRYFEPGAGRILIDGQNIRQLDVTGYRRRLAIVHQEVDVFNGTLLENLTYGNPEATLKEVEEACAIARVDEFIHLLPQGYYTVVGERGVRLSGGQRQRLGIARALLVNPDVLVFDEATSSLDYESERSIQLAMRNLLGTRTMLIIAHRLSTIREADKIVVLDQGHIVEVGSHAELLTHGGIYHRLHALQETGELVE